MQDTILAVNKYKKDPNGKPLKRRFSLTAWNAIPFMSMGKSRIPKQGWEQISETVPAEAAEIIAKKSETVPAEAAEKSLEKMSAKELLDYASRNGIEIENADTLTKSKLIDEIRKVSTHNQ